MPRIDGNDAGRQIDLMKRLSFFTCREWGLPPHLCVRLGGGGGVERGLDFTEVVNEGGYIKCLLELKGGGVVFFFFFFFSF